MRGDRVEAVVDTGAGVQTFEISATRAGRRVEVTTARGIVEVTEVTRGGNPIRTGRFMASRLVALVEHPAVEGDNAGVDVTTRRRISAGEDGRPRRGKGAAAEAPKAARRRSEAEPMSMDLGAEPEPVDLRREAERRRERDEPS